MPTKQQHFVPRVYMKAWETNVETIKNPHIKFSGVYIFEDQSSLGDGANIKSVLWMPRLYTVRFHHKFICGSCPRIMDDFVSQIYSIMRENSSNPIYAKLGHSIIRTKKAFVNIFTKLMIGSFITKMETSQDRKLFKETLIPLTVMFLKHHSMIILKRNGIQYEKGL